MTKISQTLLTYNVDNIDGDTQIYHKVNAFRDYSAANRKGLAMTTKKGVPLMCRIAVTATAGAIDRSEEGGSVNDMAFDELNETSSVVIDETTQDILPPSPTNPTQTVGVHTATHGKPDIVQMKFFGASNTWVTRNAAVKIHAARELMFKKNGVTKKERGAYDHTVRYVWSSGGDTYLTPQKGLSLPMALGTWDPSQIIWDNDASGAYLKIQGDHLSEETTTTFSTLNIQQLYLASRSSEVPDDSNLESDDVPLKFSVLRKMFAKDTTVVQDDVIELARDEQDNPPYDMDLVGNDLSSKMEIGRLQFRASQGQTASTVIEVPFGLFEIQSQVLNANQHSSYDINGEVDLSLKLLAVYPMEC